MVHKLVTTTEVDPLSARLIPCQQVMVGSRACVQKHRYKLKIGFSLNPQWLYFGLGSYFANCRSSQIVNLLARNCKHLFTKHFPKRFETWNVNEFLCGQVGK